METAPYSRLWTFVIFIGTELFHGFHNNLSLLFRLAIMVIIISKQVHIFPVFTCKCKKRERQN